MICTSQTAQEQQSANLAALHQKLQEMFATTKSSATPTKPVVMQGPVIVVRGK
jgi:hypothetical protein